MMPSTSRRNSLRYVLGLAALAVAAITCSDMTAPEGLTGPVTISYQGPPAANGGVIQLIVGQRVSPAFRVDLGGVPQTRARYFLSLPNAADSNILRVFGNGDSVEVLGRGAATLEATLVGATVGIALSTRATINVIATPAANSVDSTSLTFTSLGIGKILKGSSLKQDGSSIALNSNSLTWASADPAIAGVTKLTDSTAIVTSLGNGPTTITATFDGIDIVTVPVTVSQAFARFQLSTATFGTGEVTLVSLGETITATATPLDANGQMLLAGSQAAPTPSFASTVSGRASVSPVSGQITAIDNTDPIAPARIYATASGVPRSDSLSVVVRQRATSIVISGVRTDTISSLGATKNFTAVARDANNRDLPPSFITWTSIDQTIAQVNAGPPVVVTAIGVGTTRLAAARPSDNVGDTITLVVSNNPSSIELLPTSLSIFSLDDTVRFASAVVRNTKGDVLTGSPVTWTSLNAAIVQALADGRMVSRALGTTSVIATTSNGIADTSQVVVTNAPETLNIIPTNVTLASTGDTVAVAVDFRNSRGVSLPSSSASWSSADVSIARVAADGSGRIIATGSGDTYVLAVSPVNPARRDSVLVTVTNAPAAIATSPSNAQTLTSFGQTLQFSATVFNAAGNPIPNAPVRWSVLPGGAAFVSIDSVSGLVTAVANGAATIRARSGTITADVSVTVAQAFSPARSTIIPSRGSIAADGVDTTTVTIQLKDANDNNYVSGGVTVAPSTSRGTLSAFTNQGGGTYTVLLTAGTTSGPTTVTATVNAVAINNSGLVTFTPGAPAGYVVVVLPNASPLAGSQVTIVAQLADQFGNPVTNQIKTVTWSSTNGGTFSPAAPMVTSNGRAIVTFTTSVTPATVHTITATDNTAPTALTGSAALITRSGGPTRYAVSTSNTNPVAGDSVTITARLVDVNGNFERIPGRTVTWSSTNGGGFASPTSVTDGDGIALIRFGTNFVGGTVHTVTANDGTLAGTSPTFTTVVPTQYVVTGPATAAAGTPVIITAQLADASSNPVRQPGRTVAWSVAVGPGGFFATPTSLTDGNGRAVVAFTGTMAGIHQVRATDQVALTGLSGNINVTGGAANHLFIATQPSGTATAGVPFTIQPVIHVRDAFNNVLTSDNTTQITASRSAGTGTLGGTVTVTAVNGVVTFADLQHTVAATITIGFSSVPALTGATSGNVVVSPAALDHFAVTNTAGAAIPTQTAGAPFNIMVTAQDVFNNTQTSFTGTVTLTSPSVIGAGAGPSAAFVNGVLASHSITLNTAGSQTITATGGGQTGTSAAFTVDPAALDHFEVTNTSGGVIATQTAGAPFDIMVTAQDVFNNTQTGFTGTATFTSTSAIGAGAGPSAAFVNGVLATHSITLNTSGSHTITATGGGQSGTSAAFTVDPDVATTAQSSVTAAPTPILPLTGTSVITIQLKDQFGNNTSTLLPVTLTTDAGTLQPDFTNQSGGRYTQTLLAGLPPGTATLMGFINGAQIIATATVTW